VSLEFIHNRTSRIVGMKGIKSGVQKMRSRVRAARPKLGVRERDLPRRSSA